LLGFSVCVGSLTFTGTQIGGSLYITGTDISGDSVGFEFTSKDASFGSFTGGHAVAAGNCVGETGTATLTKQP
jgi:hypothetical protein